MTFAFVDKILSITSGKNSQGIKHVAAHERYLNLDASSKPYFITSLIGEALGQLTAWNVMQANNFTYRPVAGLVSLAQLYRPAYVGESIFLESTIKSLDNYAVHYNGIARVEQEIIFTLNGAVGPLLPMAEFIDEQDVRSQFNNLILADALGSSPSSCLPTQGLTNDSNHDMLTVGSSTQVVSAWLGAGEAQPSSILVERVAANLFECDHIVAVVPDLSITAEKYISPQAEYFIGHFPNKPVLPLSVLLECKIRLAHILLAQSNFCGLYQLSELRKIKIRSFVHPADNLTCSLTIKKQHENELILVCRSEVGGKCICIVEIVMIKIGARLF